MDKREKKELITGIRDFLRDVEEPYDHSEWEHFQRQRRKKRRRGIPLFVKLAGIAASLFLMVYASVKFLPLLERADRTKEPVLKQAPWPVGDADGKKKDSIVIDSMSPLGDSINRSNEQDNMPPIRNHLPIGPVAGVNPPPRIPTAPPAERLSTPDSPNTGQFGKTIEIKTAPLLEQVAMARKPTQGNSFRVKGVRLPNLRVLGESGMNRRRFGFGANLSPALTDNGFAFGGGVSARFALTNRISTEIGISYSRMTVGKDWEADLSDTTGFQVVGIRNTVGMLSIPVALNYAFTEHFSASVSVIPFRGVSDRRTDILQSNRWVRGDISTGDTTRRLVSERSESRRPDSLYGGKNHWGFVQLSGHVAPAFLKRYNTVIAPYVGVPVGQLRDDRYRWLHGGVSLRFYLQ